MVKVSPTKEEAVRLTKMIEYAIKNQFVEVFGKEPTIAMIAEKLGYNEDRLHSIMNGNTHRSIIEKCAKVIASWIEDGSLDADYVIRGGRLKMIKAAKKTVASNENDNENENRVAQSKESSELPVVDMDDELDSMEVVELADVDDEELETLPEIDDDDSADSKYNNIEEPSVVVVDDETDKKYDVDEKCNGKRVQAITSEDDGKSIEQSALEVAEQIVADAKSQRTKNAVVPKPKTAKDKWADAAIELGIKPDELDDHFMQMYSTKDGKMHLFKEPSGALPYRQEVFDIQAVGLGRPTVINYADDKVKYSVRYAVVFKSAVTIEASSVNDAYTKIFQMLSKQKFIVGGKELVLDNLCSDIDPIMEK